MSTLLAEIVGHILDLLAGAGPCAVLLAVLALLVLAVCAVVAEPDGPPIRWTRVALPIGAAPAVTAPAVGWGW